MNRVKYHNGNDAYGKPIIESSGFFHFLISRQLSDYTLDTATTCHEGNSMFDLTGGNSATKGTNVSRVVLQCRGERLAHRL